MKKLRTNSKKVREPIKNHVIECITNEGQTIPEAVERIEEEFKHFSHPYEVKRHPSRQERFISWMWGLPGCVNQLFKTHDILEFMASIGLPLPENKTPTEGCNLYMYLFYSEYMKIKESVQETA